MSLEDRIKATAKNIEGKVQEAVGDITGDPETQLAGKAKQVEAQTTHAVETLKDKAKEIIDGDPVKDTASRIQNTLGNIAGKVQEAVGDLTGDPETQLKGKAKQAEAQINQSVQNLKDKI